jgi:hypothetical protein
MFGDRWQLSHGLAAGLGWKPGRQLCQAHLLAGLRKQNRAWGNFCLGRRHMERETDFWMTPKAVVFYGASAQGREE